MSSALSQPKKGVVYLVGAGPGDPGLVTVRGLRLIETADVVLYDNLAAPALLTHVRKDAETVYVGKKRAVQAKTQDEINQLLIDYARAGKTVVRLKGGDPYVFGRGGEEAEALQAAGVPFQVIPGVTSAVGVAAYAGIPLTHRALTSSVVLVTGHDVDKIDWRALGTQGTLVIFMGLTTFPEIAQHLTEAGRSPATPAAAIRWGTRGDQVTLTGTLADLPRKIQEHELKPPALLIVGEVISLRGRLNWFETLPLFGQSVVVTRAREQAGPLCEALSVLGSQVIELPTIEIRPPGDWTPLDNAVQQLDEYDWLLFTSANGVRFFIERLDAGARDLRDLRAKICAIGPATAAALRALHLKVDLMPQQYVAESVLDAFQAFDLSGQRILLPRAKVARDVIPVELGKRGARVDVVAAYETVIPEDSAHRAEEIFQAPQKPNWITFTSSSTVANFARLAPIESLREVRVASIGPVTSKTARELGIQVEVEAREYTIEGLIEAIVQAQPKVAA